jgi:hypothetical protein
VALELQRPQALVLGPVLNQTTLLVPTGLAQTAGGMEGKWRGLSDVPVIEPPLLCLYVWPAACGMWLESARHRHRHHQADPCICFVHAVWPYRRIAARLETAGALWIAPCSLLACRLGQRLLRSD